MYYRHDAPESFGSKFVKWVLKISNRKDSLVKIFETGKYRHASAPIPSSVKKICNIEEQTIAGSKVWTLTHKQKQSEKVVLYLHGGGHVNNILIFHWKAIASLIEKTGAKFIIPDYPLLPDYTAKETYEMLEEVINSTLKDVKSKNLIVMGDSAGGGLSLGLAQLMRDINFPNQPSQIILLAPELDFHEFLEEVNEIAPYDVMLSPDIFEAIGSRYCGQLPRDHYMVSPGLGNLDDLGKISIFIGTHDILHPYTIRLKQRLEKENKEFNFYEYPKMLHVWLVLTFLKESKPALNQIADLINSSH